ncbi:MAG: acetyl-CoA carboxylase biotin carboxylase subunit [Verrucomicrobia bacterium]|nr:acetyl-CoA carboxylase biotin carboxylase subunit [Verrucomicrobiota bacterium]MBU6446712.1 acetyl-CoA carboxylase biotin carboxylase subunit [Verrucomicrobiota bacterium]MDE3047805.1 acetyl-CoA carboxylase biotin carboxylase subunit [Verrucomicrobiota bacterium]
MQKVLIANRGEIAVRIIRACHDLGLATVAVYSEADSEAMHVHMADEAICIGEPPSTKSYLKVANLIAACEITHADAVHPGYGFLSENANFASICESCGLTFIGPSSRAIAALGDKAQAKATAKKVKCPVIPGSDGVVPNVDAGLKEARKFGFPIFIKAVAGGGGKGIRIAFSEEDFVKKFMAARAEAEVSFNNPDVYLEKMIVNPRHVEVQVMGDQHGNYVYLGERDCTIQRRRQKLIEEAPSPKIDDSLRRKMGEAAVSIVKAAGYYSVGTVEFLLDEQGQFYFMEVNTRIQVEHTITEELTGIDLVQYQLRIARGEKLNVKQKDIEFKGHVFEFRINAEHPAQGFAPSPGLLEHYIPPGGPHVRIDSACYGGYRIPPNYDSMIAKLIVKGRTREEAIRHAKRALREFHIAGVHTTIPFHQYMLEDKRFLTNEYTISYIDNLLAEGCNFNR